uniref:Uncharacterized protein n=1 Tax=Arundo donax TaxID=35708 RepID=A0A0A8ZVX2_ARUDO
MMYQVLFFYLPFRSLTRHLMWRFVLCDEIFMVLKQQSGQFTSDLCLDYTNIQGVKNTFVHIATLVETYSPYIQQSSVLCYICPSYMFFAPQYPRFNCAQYHSFVGLLQTSHYCAALY